MIDYVSKKVLPLNLSSLKRLGIDEISLVKGQSKFIVVLVDLDTAKRALLFWHFPDSLAY